MKVSKHFDVRELVSKTFYNRYGAAFVAQWISDEYINCIEGCRALFTKHLGFEISMVINNWHTGGTFNYRGFRDASWDKSAVSNSLHKSGKAFDCNVYNKKTKTHVSPDVLREIVMANQAEFVAVGLTRIEDGDFAKTWFHGDMANTIAAKNTQTIVVVKP